MSTLHYKHFMSVRFGMDLTLLINPDKQKMCFVFTVPLMLQGRNCRHIKALAGKIVTETRPGRFQGPCLPRLRHSFHLNMLSTHTDAVLLDLDSLVCVSYSDRVSSCSPCHKKKKKKKNPDLLPLHLPCLQC